MEEEAILASQAWVNAGGLILLVVGLSLLICEFFLPSYGLFGFAGATCIVIGVIQLHQTGYIDELPVNSRTLSTMAGVGLLLTCFGAKQTLKLYRKNNTTGAEAMIGKDAWVLNWRGKKGRIRVMGEDWQAYSEEEYKLKGGDQVMVSKIDGLKIKVIYQEK